VCVCVCVCVCLSYQLPLGENMLALDCYTLQRWGPLAGGVSKNPSIHPQVTYVCLKNIFKELQKLLKKKNFTNVSLDKTITHKYIRFYDAKTEALTLLLQNGRFDD